MGRAHLEAGQLIPMIPGGTTREWTAFTVHSFQAPQRLLWSKPDSTWAWSLTETEMGGTRLVTPDPRPVRLAAPGARAGRAAAHGVRRLRHAPHVAPGTDVGKEAVMPKITRRRWPWGHPRAGSSPAGTPGATTA